MVYFTFAIFFAFNFSLWFMLPALLLRNIIKPGKKKKDKNFKFDYVIYSTLSVIYGLSYLMFYKLFLLRNWEFRCLLDLNNNEMHTRLSMIRSRRLLHFPNLSNHKTHLSLSFLQNRGLLCFSNLSNRKTYHSLSLLKNSKVLRSLDFRNN